MNWKDKEPVISGNPKVKELADHRARVFPVGRLTEPPKGICVWCFVNKNPTYRHKYCSELCQQSAYLFCYPQVYGPAYLKEKYGNKCNHCERGFNDGHKNSEGFALWYETDHIIPIFQGGTALGWENIQLLCVDCHRIKTAEERRK